MTVGRGIYLYIIVSKEVVVDRRFSILPSSGSLYIEYNIIILYGVRCVRVCASWIPENRVPPAQH